VVKWTGAGPLALTAGDAVPLSCSRHSAEQYSLFDQYTSTWSWPQSNSPLARLLANEASFEILFKHGGQGGFAGRSGGCEGMRLHDKLLSIDSRVQ
jgi:hypothetical protein